MTQVMVKATSDRGAPSSSTPTVNTPGSGATTRDPEWWVEPIRWAALAVWIAIPILSLVAQPIAGRIVWTVAVASLPLFIVLVGYHRWRRICPLAFCNQIMVRLRRPGTRRMPQVIEDRYYLIPVGLFFVGLWLRLIWTNGDGGALVLFFIGISVVAFLVGTVFTGKTWCNYICPVSFIEKIYTEPNGLRETRNSQCAKCTACKKACPDISEENGYWKEIESPTKRLAYFAYPGLVFGFYTYYWLQSRTWDYYFGGSWTDQPGVVGYAFLPGTSPETAGFFFLPAVPRAVAAALTLALFALGSFVIFSLLERVIGRILRRRDPTIDAIRVRHIMFGLAAFTAFVTFYSFAGQPTLRKVEWLPAYTVVLIVVTATLFLVRRLTRTPQAFAEQAIARNIIKRWDWPGVRPPKELHDAVVMHNARVEERDRAYAQVVEAYQDAVRETLASGLVTRQEVQRLESLRNQLQIKRADHEQVMATLAEEDRALLSDPTLQPTAEERLQVETYARALSRYLATVPGAGGPDERFMEQLRQEFRVTPEQHQAILDRLLRDGNADGTFSRMVEAVQSAEMDTQSLAVLSGQTAYSAVFFAELLTRARHRTIVRLVHGVGSDGDADVNQVIGQLESQDEAQHSAAIESLSARLPAELGERLKTAHAEAAAQAPRAQVASAYLDHPDAYVRAAALYALAENEGGVSTDDVAHMTGDEHELVRETAAGIARRRANPSVRDQMLTIEKMIALQCVPIFASLGPVELEELASSSSDTDYGQGQALCVIGEAGDEVFVVLGGQVAVVAGTTADSPLIRLEKTGAVIGEMAVLETAPRSASVFASEGGAHVLRLKGDAFRAALNSDPVVAEGVMRSLARRIRTREAFETVPETKSELTAAAGGMTVIGVLAVSAIIAATLLLSGGGTAVAAVGPGLSHACDGCPNIFQPFPDASGQVRSAPRALVPGEAPLDASNAMFNEDLGKNAQACYDCHQPRQGFTILVPFIQSTFDSTLGTDSIFATSDTANRPDADISTLKAKQSAFALFLNLGIVRIGKSQAAGDFTVTPQTTTTFGTLPKPSCPNNNLQQTTDCDPQGLGGPPTLSVFRRPLVNTNVAFESTVLWDGRASINNMDGQVKRAAQTLLLSETCDTPVSPTPCTPTITPAQEHDIARFMTGVFTAQDQDNTVGNLNVQGATGGIDDLVALASDPHQPCRRAGPSQALTPFTPATCTPANSPVMTLFTSWASLPPTQVNRLAVARGQALFNGGAVIHGGPPGATSCSSCHALNNLGNSPADAGALAFVRLGLDSPDFLAALATHDTSLGSFVTRSSGLPVYTVTGTATPTTCPTLIDPVSSSVVIGSNMRTTDPGRALVSGKCADLGAFKPPILRDAAVRAPYFHNGSAATLDDVVNFYNVRFSINLSAQQHSDLVAFLRSL
jgi:CRP-like cAMP-binding protein/cytochrome c peroxidase